MSKEENQKLFDERRKELLDRQLSNSEAQDKAILTLASSGLVISVTFVRYVIELETACYTSFLYSSWLLFACAVVSTVLSFLIGQKAIVDHLEISRKYYLDDDDSYENTIPFSSKLNDFLNVFSSLSFMFAILALALFIGLNV